MRLRFKKDQEEFTINEKLIMRNPDQRQLIAQEINAKEAQKYLNDLPWAYAIESPTMVFFRDT